MRLHFVVVLLSACGPSQPAQTATTPTQQEPPVRGPLDPDPPQALECNATEPCRPLPEELTTQCAKPGQTVSVGTCGAYKVLVRETDPESVTFVSEKRYYDGADKLVAVQLFVNEYGRDVTFGTLTPCSIQNPKPACPPT